MTKEKKSKTDLLAEATNSKLHWNDLGMDDLERGWEDFILGTRVEVRTTNNIWRKGTVVETHPENERGLCIKCDEKWHDNVSFLKGHGAFVMVYMNTRRGILSNIRKIENPFENNDRLPKNIAPFAQRALEKADVKFNGDCEENNLFYKVVLPESWCIERCTKRKQDFLLLDSQKFIRASILCMYNNGYRLQLEGRFNLKADKIHYKKTNKLRVLVIEGHRNILFTTSNVLTTDRSAYLRAEREKVEEAEKWLRQKYPHWRRTDFYWK